MNFGFHSVYAFFKSSRQVEVQVLGRTTPSLRGAGLANGITNFATVLSAGPAYLKASFDGFL